MQLRWASLLPFAAMVALVGVLLLDQQTPIGSDSTTSIYAHMLASAGLTVATHGVLYIGRQRRPSLVVVMTIAAALTALLEVAQLLVPPRAPELADLVSGLAGVLLAAIVVELIAVLWSDGTSLRASVVAATIASLFLAALVIGGFRAETIASQHPGGSACSATQLTGTGERITIGTRALDGSCLETESGGLGVLGGGLAPLSGSRVLVSSKLPDVGSAIEESSRLVVRARFTTGSVSQTGAATLLVLMDSNERQLISVGTRGPIIEVLGPMIAGTPRSVLRSRGLEANTSYVVEAYAAGDELRITLDGIEVGFAQINPAWLDGVGSSAHQLLVGNNPIRSRPFTDPIEWIEIDT